MTAKRVFRHAAVSPKCRGGGKLRLTHIWSRASPVIHVTAWSCPSVVTLGQESGLPLLSYGVCITTNSLFQSSCVVVLQSLLIVIFYNKKLLFLPQLLLKLFNQAIHQCKRIVDYYYKMKIFFQIRIAKLEHDKSWKIFIREDFDTYPRISFEVIEAWNKPVVSSCRVLQSDKGFWKSILASLQRRNITFQFVTATVLKQS